MRVSTLGFLNLNKPAGLTSHDCVARVRRILKMKRVGHGGTLDPAATGVLPIALDKATRLLQFLPEGKAYRATVRFGMKTTTDDLEGEIISSSPASHLALEAIQAVLPQFVGTLQQIPPMYSAIQVEGQRLYDLARAGTTIDLQPRTVTVHRIEVLNWRPGDHPEVDLEIACGPGTYIRSIARDLGELLQVGGTLAALVRTESCGLLLSDSLTLEEFEEQVREQTWSPLPVSQILPLNRMTLTELMVQRWGRGQSISEIAPEVLSAGPVQVYDQNDRFLGIGQFSSQNGAGVLAPRIVFEPAM